MRVTRIKTIEQLAALEPEWDRLSRGVPLRSWTWLASWWGHLGCHRANAELYVLCVYDQSQRLVGIAPWYLERSALAGRVVHFLGSGSICSDYLSVLCERGQENPVTAALAQWLLDDRPTVSDWLARERHDRWDLLNLTGVDAEDVTIGLLTEALAARGALAHARQGYACWRMALPATWDEYLDTLSKSHRKQIRRLERSMFDTGRTVLHSVRRPEELDRGFEILTHLHQQRWLSQGRSGAFACSQFDAFHRDAIRHLLSAGQLRMSWLEIDGRPAAAEYGLAGDGVIYAYQSGMEPALRDLAPGQLSMIATLKQAIADGYRAYDLMRGDEPYKAHWRAVQRPSVEIRIRPGSTVDWLRHSVWSAGENLKRWARAGRRRAAALASRDTTAGHSASESSVTS